jgi:hypothetical protein
MIAALHTYSTDQPTMLRMVPVGARRGFMGHHYKYALGAENQALLVDKMCDLQ